MSGDAEWLEDPNDELTDNEFPDEEENDDDPSVAVPCPQCSAEIYEEAVRCPSCGTYVTHQTGSVWAGRPIGWIVLGLLGVAAAALALAGLL